MTLPRPAYPVGVALLLIAAWYATIAVTRSSPLVLPPPHTVVETFSSNLGYLLDHAWTTLYETVLGFLLGVGLGVAIAIVLHFLAWLRPAIYPYLLTAQILPKVALAPVFLIWLGFGPGAKIAIAALVCLFPVVVNTGKGLETAPKELRQMLHALGASRWRIFRSVELPHALPLLFAALRMCIAFALIGAVIGEFVGADSGLGYVLTFSISNVDATMTMSALAMLAAMGICLFAVVSLLERLLIPWEERVDGELSAT